MIVVILNRTTSAIPMFNHLNKAILPDLRMNMTTKIARRNLSPYAANSP